MTWQQLPSTISPVLVSLGPLQIRWYSLMYIVAFALTYLLVIYRVRREEGYPYSVDTIADIILWGLLV